MTPAFAAHLDAVVARNIAKKRKKHKRSTNLDAGTTTEDEDGDTKEQEDSGEDSDSDLASPAEPDGALIIPDLGPNRRT